MIFPSDYFDSHKIEPEYQKEYDAAIEFGFLDVFLFSYSEWEQSRKVKLYKVCIKPF